MLVLIVSVTCCKLVTGQEKYSKVRIPVVSSVVADLSGSNLIRIISISNPAS
jgi:hypothetical protein